MRRFLTASVAIFLLLAGLQSVEAKEIDLDTFSLTEGEESGQE